MKLNVKKIKVKIYFALFGSLPRLFSFSLKEQKIGIQDNQKGEGRSQEVGFSTGAVAQENP